MIEIDKKIDICKREEFDNIIVLIKKQLKESKDYKKLKSKNTKALFDEITKNINGFLDKLEEFSKFYKEEIYKSKDKLISIIEEKINEIYKKKDLLNEENFKEFNFIFFEKNSNTFNEKEIEEDLNKVMRKIFAIMVPLGEAGLYKIVNICRHIIDLIKNIPKNRRNEFDIQSFYTMLEECNGALAKSIIESKEDKTKFFKKLETYIQKLDNFIKKFTNNKKRSSSLRVSGSKKHRSTSNRKRSKSLKNKKST